MARIKDRVERLEREDFVELIEMLNEVFTAAHAPHEFRTLLPALYRPTAEHMRCNLAIRRDGRIAAVMGVFPITWRVGGQTLRIAGIGGVATRAAYRGQGLMRQLMVAAIEQIQSQGYDLSYLGGQRQRYRYYGWERAGVRYRMRVAPANLRHGLGGDRADGVVLGAVGDDEKLLGRIQALHQSQKMYCVRDRAPLADYLGQWKQRPWAARDGQGQVIGYVVGQPGGEFVAEVVGRDTVSMLATVRAWVEMAGASYFIVPAVATEAVRAMAMQVEHSVIEASGNWRIFDWVKVAGALLRVRQALSGLSPGEVVVGIAEEDVTVRLWVDGNRTGCEPVRRKADVRVADGCAAARLLFGPMRPSITARLSGRARLLEAWCPLPLGICPTDQV